jgi:hypothetical protein
MKLNGEDMKNAKLSSIRTCSVAVAIMFLVSLSTNLMAQTTGDQKVAGEWKTIEDVFGFPGANLPGGVVRFNMPRKDLHVTLAGTEIKPGLALGAWAAFHHIGDDAMVMGDLVLTEDEVAPVMNALLDGGVEVTAIHNRLVGESPKIIYIHMGGHGDPVKMAQTIKHAVGFTKTPLPQVAGTKETAADLAFDAATLEKIMGRPGNVSGGVLHFSAPRAENLTEEGMDAPPSMGAGTVINFQPTGNGRAAIAGDFAMTGKEVGPVMKVLHDNGIQAVALHSHALDDVPRLFYMHFWANDDAVKLAKGLRAALDNTNSAK